MQDMTISATRVLAYVLWTLGIVCIGASFFGPWQLAAVGLALVGAGMVNQVRGYLCQLGKREHEAFQMGQEVGRDSVRSIH